MNQIGYGIDVSQYQNPAALPWDSWSGKVDFVIARAAYGIRLDPMCREHVAQARKIGAKVGIYLFFRVGQSVDDQFHALRSVAQSVGLDQRDIVPAIDIEKDGALPAKSWAAAAEALSQRIVQEWGNCLMYVRENDWEAMGSPLWMPRLPLWVAHYTAAPSPKTPAGVEATIWQHRVGRFDPSGPGGEFKEFPQIDQDRLLRPLPMVGETITEDDRRRVEARLLLWLDSQTRDLAEPYPLPDEEQT